MEEHTGIILSDKLGYKVIDCAECGFAHLDPIPNSFVLDNYYKDFYTKHKPNYIKEAEEDLNWWHSWYSFYNKHLTTMSRGRTLLDVGSGPGFFIEYMRDKGWTCTGMDLSNPRNVEGVVEVDFSNMEVIWQSTLLKYHAITMCEYLEHCPNPRYALRLAHSMLEDKGVLMLVVPNDFNPLQLMLVGKHGEYWVAPPAHINYFNHTSLAKLLHSCGFSIHFRLSTFPVEAFSLISGTYGYDYIGNPSEGRRMHAHRKYIDGLLGPGTNPFYEGLVSLGIGREIVLFAVKT